MGAAAAQGHAADRRSGGRNLALVVVFGIVIPITVNIALFVVANFVVLDRTDAQGQARTPMRIEVIGRQWFWEVRYPGTGAVTANVLQRLGRKSRPQQEFVDRQAWLRCLALAGDWLAPLFPWPPRPSIRVHELSAELRLKFLGVGLQHRN